ncbi:hypothetical protein D3C73_1555950 [compost metagenome]
MCAINQSGHHDTGGGVAQREGEALQQADLGIAQGQRGFDRVHQDADDLPVDIGKHETQEEQADGIAIAQGAG